MRSSEDVDEKVYKLDRALNPPKTPGRFEGVRAVVLGEMVDIEDGKPHLTETRFKTDLFGQSAVPDNIPLCMNFPCGHG